MTFRLLVAMRMAIKLGFYDKHPTNVDVWHLYYRINVMVYFKYLRIKISEIILRCDIIMMSFSSEESVALIYVKPGK